MKTTTLLSLSVVAAVAVSGAKAPPKEYPECQEGDKQSYFGALTQELQACSSKAKYDFTTLPTPDQREALCKCKSLLEKLPYIRVPRCRLDLDGNLYKFKDAITSIFSECGSIAVEEVPPPTLAPGAAASSAGSDAAAEPTAKPKATPTMTPKPTSKAPKTTAPAVNESGEADASGSSDAEEIQTPKPKATDAKTKETKQPASSKPAPVPTATPKSAATAALVSVAASVASAAVAALLL
ncbi:hypothetical protein PINS_up007509 [Pythium insidiosum]|nr:hypothetical protein PINS_up007509 [Pythium insidiosum]